MARLTPAQALARARRGVAFLDRKMPGWRRKVRRTRLRMEKGYIDRFVVEDCGCILAQLDAERHGGDGYYSRGAGQLGIDPTGVRAVSLGLVLRGPDSRNQEYEVLTDAWRIALREPAGA